MSTMRFIFILFITITLLTSATGKASAQTQTERIALFCKVWGFIKYHHPNVAGGSINWDSVFMAHIDAVISTRDIETLNAELSALITAAGPIVNPRMALLPGVIFVKNHDLHWLHESHVLNKENSKALQFIYIHRNRGSNRFVKYNNYTDYSGEKTYAGMTWPAVAYRLLFLARFWNAINYYDPYKFITSENWNSVLTRFIPRMRGVKDTTAYHKILLLLAVALHDGHAQLDIDDEIWGKYLLPFYTTVLGDTVVITHTDDEGRCAKAGIRQGDLLVAVNNEQIAGRIARFKPYISSSNSASLNRGLMYTLLRTTDTTERVTIKRRGKTFTTAISCIPAGKRNWQYQNNYTANDKGYEMIGKSIIKVYTDQSWGKNADTIKALMRTKKAIIFDARSWMADDAFYNIFDMFLSVPEPISMETEIMPDEPGYFKWVLSPKMGRVNPHPYRGTVIILADERCQSQGEYTVMTLQTIPHSVTIGSQTGGLDGAVSSIPMGGTLGITHSGYGIYYPDKTPTQQRGVRIDILAKKTVKTIVNGQDPAFEAALKYLRGKGIH
ncbi:MAG TPA: S41 family peptidase [Puia sp.]|nr:S41 family peptidase [Puia sp.]